MVAKSEKKGSSKYVQIAVRMDKSLKDNIDSAAKCEGISTPDWVRDALSNYLLVKTNICPECLTFNPLDSKFCKKCGRGLINFQERLLTRRGEMLSNYIFVFGVSLRDIKNAADGNASQGCLSNLISTMKYSNKFWYENKNIINQFGDEIAEYALSDEDKEQLAAQNDLVTELDNLAVRFSMDIERYENIENPDWKLIWKTYENSPFIKP